MEWRMNFPMHPTPHPVAPLAPAWVTDRPCKSQLFPSTFTWRGCVVVHGAC
jgi:hypothetical protein